MIMEMRVRIAEIRVSNRHRQDMGDLAGLARSIADVGLIQPIAVWPNGELAAGERRLRAVQSLGWEEIPAYVIQSVDELINILRVERDENTQRKAFTPGEMVAVAADLEPLEREAAKERQEESRGNRGENFTPRSEPDKGKSLDKVAAALGVSRPTLVKAQEVVKAAVAEPERFARLVKEMNRTGRVNGVYRKLKTQQQAERINREPSPLPTSPFRVIVADPPWAYDKRAEDPSHRASLPYPPMSPDQIIAKARDEWAGLAADDAILWLWTTNAHMPVAFEVVRAWGFQHKTILTWVKDRMGTGDWLRGQSEHCIMAVRGYPTVTLTNQTTVIHGPLREHSRKPDEFYALVEALCPGSKLEMFARQERNGWQMWGSETERFGNV